MTKWKKWAVLALAVLALGGAVFKALSKRQAQQDAVAAMSTGKTEAVVELGAADLVKAEVRELTQGIAVSGALKAANSALVKVRVPGELQALTVREGDTVSAGQVLARVEPVEYQARLRQAREQADAAQAQVDIAQRQYDNNKSLVNQGFISQTALETSAAGLQGAKATQQAARSAMDVAQKALDDTVLRAPIGGQISQRLAQPGERVAVETRILEIVSLDRLELEAALSAAEAASVRVGQEAMLSIEGLKDPLPAKVARINPSTQTGTRSVLVYLAVGKAPGLRQGMFAQGQLSAAKSSVLAIPLSAVRTERPEPYVQVIDKDKVVHKPVRMGAQGMVRDEAMVAVSGIEPGTLVLRGTVGPLRASTGVKLSSPKSAS